MNHQGVTAISTSTTTKDEVPSSLDPLDYFSILSEGARITELIKLLEPVWLLAFNISSSLNFEKKNQTFTMSKLPQNMYACIFVVGLLLLESPGSLGLP